MKVNFKGIEKVKKPHISMRLAFVLFILLVTVIIIGVLSVISYFVSYSGDDMPAAVWIIIAGVVISASVAVFVGVGIIAPIRKLDKSMGKVAQGNFKVKLDTEKGFAEIRRMNESFNIMTAELDSTEILQTDFVSSVSHEFKTPINAIEGYATLLQDADEEERAVYTEKILSNTRRLSSLVGNILLLSKVDNSVIRQGKTEFSLDEQIRQSIVYLEPRWMEKKTEFNVELEPLELNGTAQLLNHVWTNLIENAIKFGPFGGTVNIRLKNEEGVAVFTIEDEGPGVTEHDIKHMFDKFYQSDSSHKAEGNGLGLSLVKRILDVEGGEITVENVCPHGCRFTVMLAI